MDKAGGRVTRPGSHSSRPKRAGSATLENSIADRAALVEGAGVRTGALERAKITPEACAAGRRAADHTDAAAFGRYMGVTGRVQACAQVTRRGPEPGKIGQQAK